MNVCTEHIDNKMRFLRNWKNEQQEEDFFLIYVFFALFIMSSFFSLLFVWLLWLFFAQTTTWWELPWCCWLCWLKVQLYKDAIMLYENRTMKHSFAVMLGTTSTNAIVCWHKCKLYFFIMSSSAHMFYVFAQFFFTYFNVNIYKYIHLFMPTYVDVCCAFCWMISQFMQSIDLFFFVVFVRRLVFQLVCVLNLDILFLKALTDIKRSSNCLLEWR